jgi:hypothetical protein
MMFWTIVSTQNERMRGFKEFEVINVCEWRVASTRRIITAQAVPPR